MPKLNGWRRLGILAAILTLFAAWVAIGIGDARSAQEDWDFWLNDCLQHGGQGSVCTDRADAHRRRDEAQMRGNTAFLMEFAAGGVLVFWVLIEATVGAARWVRRGFQEGKRSQPSSSNKA